VPVSHPLLHISSILARNLRDSIPANGLFHIRDRHLANGELR